MEDILVKKFIGKNADVIYDKMEKRGSFNVFCMLFSFFYFLYRKMYLIGLISFLIQSLIANYVKNILVSIVCMVILGFIFYPLYKFHIIRKINKIKEKATTEEEINNMCTKRGGTSIIAAIIVPLILIIILIASFGMIILDSATNVINNQNNNDSNISNYYSYNGAKIKYDNDWQQEYVEAGGQKYKALCEKNGNIVIICLQVADINDGISDYSLSSKRQELYDELIDTETATYSANGITISKQTYGFKQLFNNIYYEYHEIHKDSYVRTYTILNSKNNTAASLMVVSDSYITDVEESKINEVLKTIEF